MEHGLDYRLLSKRSSQKKTEVYRREKAHKKVYERKKPVERLKLQITFDMKFYQRTDSFHFSWEQVAHAFWFRYPNPYSSHVQTVDVLWRKVENGKLHSRRLLTKTVRIPCFGKNIVIKNEPIIEESVIDPSQKTIVTYTWNCGSKTAVVEEKCVYKPCGEKSTAVERKAWISSSRSYFALAIESYMGRKIRKTINRTCQGLQHVLESKFPLPVGHENKATLMENTETLRDRAKKATELAKSRASPLITAYTQHKQ